jgi:hypothetical protein
VVKDAGQFVDLGSVTFSDGAVVLADAEVVEGDVVDGSGARRAALGTKHFCGNEVGLRELKETLEKGGEVLVGDLEMMVRRDDVEDGAAAVQAA